MASTDFDPWQFLKEGRFSDAIAYFQARQSYWSDGDWCEPSTLGTVYLCLKEYDMAAQMFALANAMSARNKPFCQAKFLEEEGGALWLAGRKEEGAELWYRSVKGLWDRTTIFADFSGGISDGLLLWYGGVSLQRKDFIAVALKFLKRASKRVKAENMPGPLAQHVLHGKPIEEILFENFKDRDISNLEKSAATNILLCRDLTQVLLCQATAKRFAGEEKECLAIFRRCTNLNNHMIQIEWFLAQGEAEKN